MTATAMKNRNNTYPPIDERADFTMACNEAMRILEEFGYKTPPINPVIIARELGVKVIFLTLPNKHQNISGFYDAEEDAIYINEEEYPLRQTFTLAHELGHRIMHREWARSSGYQMMMRDQTAMRKDKYEQEADCFAANLLVPRHMLKKYIGIVDSVDDLSQLFAVSRPVIQNRLNREFKK